MEKNKMDRVNEKTMLHKLTSCHTEPKQIYVFLP